MVFLIVMSSNEYIITCNKEQLRNINYTKKYYHKPLSRAHLSNGSKHRTRIKRPASCVWTCRGCWFKKCIQIPKCYYFDSELCWHNCAMFNKIIMALKCLALMRPGMTKHVCNLRWRSIISKLEKSLK